MGRKEGRSKKEKRWDEQNIIGGEEGVWGKDKLRCEYMRVIILMLVLQRCNFIPRLAVSVWEWDSVTLA